MSSTTSPIYDVWDVFTARMAALVLTLPDADTSIAPASWFGDPSQPELDELGNSPHAIERIVVGGKVETPASDWGPLGRKARDERWQFDIFVETAVEGLSSAETKTRLRQLTGAVEMNVRELLVADASGGTPAAWVQYPRREYAVVAMNPLILPGGTTSAGYIGQANITIGCLFRTNLPS